MSAGKFSFFLTITTLVVSLAWADAALAGDKFNKFSANQGVRTQQTVIVSTYQSHTQGNMSETYMSAQNAGWAPRPVPHPVQRPVYVRRVVKLASPTMTASTSDQSAHKVETKRMPTGFNKMTSQRARPHTSMPVLFDRNAPTRR